MGKTTKIWLITATSLVVIGIIIFAAVMSKLNWNFVSLNTGKYETNIHEISKEFTNISMDTETADILFALSNDGKCRVECYEEKKVKHSVNVEKDTLIINVIDERAWYDYIGINLTSPKITIYLPKSEYASLAIYESVGRIKIPSNFSFNDVDISLSTGDVEFSASASKLVKIEATTGNICVRNTSADSLDLSASTGAITVSDVTCKEDTNINLSTGKTNLTNVECKNLISSGSTGNIALNNVIAKEKFLIDRSTGNVKFDNSDANEIFVETDTGDVKGSLLTDKIFFTETDTGKVDVPKTVTGGKCEITTDTGNIKITVNE